MTITTLRKFFRIFLPKKKQKRFQFFEPSNITKQTLEKHTNH